MRILEPHQFKGIQQQKKKRPVKPVAILLALALLGAAGWYGYEWYGQRTRLAQEKRTQEMALRQAASQAAKPKTTPKIFTGSQFKELYQRVMQTYPNTEAFMEYPEITGNDAADTRIRQLAAGRGFLPTRIPVTALIKTNEPRLQGETDDLLQPLAYKHWLELKAAAEAEGIPLSLLSAYRSPEWQRDLFMSRLYAQGGDVLAIAAGVQDQAVLNTLSITSTPGYSRHHTGYAVDFWCEDGSGSFGSSSCFAWLKADNYLRAKQHGWMPSYPEDADEQGPEPEPWEYVWVGRDVLYE